MKKISVLGHEGKLGSELVRLGCVPLCADITEPTDLREAIAVVNPDIIINCAAVTDVDACEDALQPMANLVNSLGVANLRDAFHGRIIQISTDFVFNGRNGPYKENDIPFPISHYGSTKLDGEKYILNSFWPGTIIRTTILYGKHGKKDFVSGILEALKGTKRIEVTTALVGSPTYAPHLAEGIMYLLNSDRNLPSIVNISGTDLLSRYDFALMIASVFGLDKERLFPTSRVWGEARRPRKAGFVLTLAKRLGIPLYSAIEGLEAYRDGLQ